MSADETLKRIIDEMAAKHGCHTVILYGSRAKQGQDRSSDYDIIAIRPEGIQEKDCRIFEGAYLDAFLFSEADVANPDASLVRLNGGLVLTQKDNIGTELLRKIKILHDQGPNPLPLWEKHEIIIWMPKMIERVRNGGIVANYRRHWLMFELIRAYFQLRDIWFLGPKEAFSWLKENEPRLYNKFESSMEPNSKIDTIEDLINDIIENTPLPATETI